MQTAYYNGKIFTGHSVAINKAILVDGNTITAIVQPDAIPSTYKKHDLNGHNIAPAFIDVQIYGGNKKLFSADLSTEALHATYQYCLKGGCSHFVITMATNVSQKYKVAFERIRQYRAQGGKGLLGLHLEGPYINPSKRGAHLASHIETPVLKEVGRLIELGEGVFKMMTLAPERCGNDVINLLLKNNILVSAGHTNATYQEAMAAFEKGIPLATHLYNAMSGLHHREAGMVGAIFSHPSVMSSIVCDGLHVSYPAIRIAKQLMGQRLFLITDAVTESEGEYTHLYKGDHYTLPEGTLSGSALNMMRAVRNVVEHAGIPLEEALRMAATYPAQLFPENKLGRIEKGYEAAFVVFDDDFKSTKVYC